MVKKLRVRILAGAAGEFSSPALTFCADSYSVTVPSPVLRQWDEKKTPDAEIIVPSGENTSLNILPLKPGVGQYIAIHATFTARDFFLAYFYPSGPFTRIFSKTSPDFSCVGYG